jgi:hypothetical protein
MFLLDFSSRLVHILFSAPFQCLSPKAWWKFSQYFYHIINSEQVQSMCSRKLKWETERRSKPLEVFFSSFYLYFSAIIARFRLWNCLGLVLMKSIIFWSSEKSLLELDKVGRHFFLAVQTFLCHPFGSLPYT